ncbi:Secreted effector protein PipB2 [Orientia tsutsugamushi]|uniref:Secreted effector protein PipB2 n=2 Tax=Orientia tsutsugamushi TaxID=784 RepID=A0A2R8F253_ORITS|nr:Secreted effector protein PipB2 [Orientia tsutsugamushi]
MKNILPIDICLSKHLKSNSYEFLKNSFDQNNDEFTVNYSLNLESLQKNIDLYLEDEDFKLQMEKEFGYSKKNQLKMIIGQIPINNEDDQDYELDSQYMKLQKALRNFLYEPEDGVALLLEYQEKYSYAQENASFNEFLRDKLSNVQDLSELRQYPNLYSNITSIYSNVESLRNDLKSKSVVANIHHNPQMMADNKQQMLNDDFLFEEQPTVNFQTHILTGTEDFQPGANECREELFNGGNFQGSTFRNIEFDFSPKGINFRNCLFDGVAFSNHKIKDLDLRGVKLQHLLFSNNGSIENVSFDVADHNVLKKLGVLRLEQSDELKEEQDHSINKYYTKEDYTRDLQDLSKRTANKLTAIRAAPATGSSIFSYFQSAVNYLQGSIPSIQTLQATIEKDLQDIKTEIEKSGKDDLDYNSLTTHYNQLQNLYYADKRLQHQEANAAKEVTIKNVTCDPTYRCNQEDTAYKVTVKVNRSDLEDFLKEGQGQSCCEFFSKKYSGYIQNKENSLKEKLSSDITGIKVVVVPDASKENLSELDFSKKDMSSVNLAYCNLTSCNFSKANLDGSCLEGSNVTDTKFYKAKLNDTNLINICGSRAVFDKVNGSNVRLMGAELGDVTNNAIHSNPATFKEAKLLNVDSFGADLSCCDMSRAEFKQADFSQANMMRVKAQHTKMQNANFELAVANNIDLSCADVMKSSFQDAEMINADCSKAILQSANLTGADARLSKFNESNMEKVIAVEANLTDVKANKINAQNANFESAIMNHIQMQNSNLTNMNMSHVQAKEASFDQSDLTDANAEEANLINSSFVSANMSQMNIKGSDLTFFNLMSANLQNIQFSPSTVLVGANIEDAKNVDDKLKQHMKDQDHTFLAGLGLNKRYPKCIITDKDGVNMRLKAQRLGYKLLTSMPKEISLLPPNALSSYIKSGEVDVYKLANSFISTVENDKEELPLSEKDKKVGYIDSLYGDYLAYLGANSHNMLSCTLAKFTNLTSIIEQNFNKEGWKFITGNDDQSVVKNTLVNILSELYKEAKEGVLQPQKTDDVLPEQKYMKARKIWKRKIPIVKHILEQKYIKLLLHAGKEFWRESNVKTKLATIGIVTSATTAAVVSAVPVSVAYLSYKTVQKVMHGIRKLKNNQQHSVNQPKLTEQTVNQKAVGDIDLESNKIINISNQDLNAIRTSIDNIDFVNEQAVVSQPLPNNPRNKSKKQQKM